MMCGPTTFPGRNAKTHGRKRGRRLVMALRFVKREAPPGAAPRGQGKSKASSTLEGLIQVRSEVLELFDTD